MRHKLIYLTVLLLTGLMSVSVFAQVSVTIDRLPLKEALVEVERQSGYSFFCSSLLPDQDAVVSVKAEDASIGYVMDKLLEGLNVSYELKPDFQIVLIEKPQTEKIHSSKPVSRKLSGKVVDASGMPVIGAGVMVEGTGTGTVTDVDGSYSLDSVSENTVLEFSCMGYQSVTVEVGNRKVLDVTLREDTQFLEEVVVVGYGTQKKVNLTGSVSMVSSDEISARPISSVSSGLQGLLPGVTVVNPNGQPGESNTTIRVRGIGTIGNANPLILIDGVEGDISAINPEDIESVSVLKDAASASIYGSRAANGVLLVTTKKVNKASDSKARVSLGAYFGLQTPTRLPQMCDAIEFMTLDNEARQNVGTSPAWTEDQFAKVRDNTDPNFFANTDWLSQVLNKFAPQQNYNVTLSGSLGSSGYMLSYRYFDQKGLTVGSSTGEKRHNVRFKMDTKLLDRVTLSSNLSYTSRKVTSPVDAITSGGGAIYTPMRLAAKAPAKYTDGTGA